MFTKLVFLILACTAPFVTAQTFKDISAPASHSYNQNSSGVITRSEFGLCWRSGSWNENDAIAGCDGALASPFPNPTAPEVANSMVKATPIVMAAKSCNFTLRSDQAFAFNKAELSTAAKRQIDRDFVPRLAACKSVESISITGHTDHLGSTNSNQILSEKRAKAVADYLQAKGLTNKMNINGAGSSQALKSCNEKLAHQKLVACLAPNRRVVIEFTGY